MCMCLSVFLFLCAYKSIIWNSRFSLPVYDEVFGFKRVNIPGHDNLDRLNKVNLKKCHEECLKHPECFSYEYHETMKVCDLSNATHWSHDLKPNDKGWDIYIIGPGQLLVFILLIICTLCIFR